MTAKTKRKTDVQFIRAPGGAELAVLPRAEYDRLVALAEEASEDAGTARIVRNSKTAIAVGREVVLPKAVVDKLVAGENPIRTIREWREMIQGELAVMVGISQNYLSDLETGKRKGPAALMVKLARARRADGCAGRGRRLRSGDGERPQPPQPTRSLSKIRAVPLPTASGLCYRWRIGRGPGCDD